MKQLDALTVIDHGGRILLHLIQPMDLKVAELLATAVMACKGEERDKCSTYWYTYTCRFQATHLHFLVNILPEISTCIFDLVVNNKKAYEGSLCEYLEHPAPNTVKASNLRYHGNFEEKLWTFFLQRSVCFLK
jgi:hypothetical protein